jgi:hypothetical protein
VARVDPLVLRLQTVTEIAMPIRGMGFVGMQRPAVTRWAVGVL